jgi:quercetin dioxygenase-like cupin family protein
MSTRTIYNPVQKDKVIFLETVSETNGRYTLVEVDLAAGGGVGLHYHKTYSESFVCLEGELKIQLDREIHTLKVGDDPVTAKPFVLHRFFNGSKIPCKFRVTISPGCRGFEESLQIAYGLARDGRTNKKGLPRKFSHVALLLVLSESKLTGWRALVEKLLVRTGEKAIKNGEADELRRAYVNIRITSLRSACV